MTDSRWNRPAGLTIARCRSGFGRVIALLALAESGRAAGTLTGEELALLEQRSRAGQVQVLAVERHDEARRLHAVSRAVDPRSPGIDRLTRELERTASALRAGGIAAVQIGVPVRVVLVRRSDHSAERAFHLFLNPVLFAADTRRVGSWESCLSIPWGYRYTERAASIILTYQTAEGEIRTSRLENAEAVILQQELDHLNGRLLNDHLGADQFVPPERMGEIEAAARPACRDEWSEGCTEAMRRSWHEWLSRAAHR